MRATFLNYMRVVFLFSCCLVKITAEKNDFKVITVATEETDGFRRFMNSAKKYDVSVVVLGMGDKWSGGDVNTGPGGGQKVRLLKKELEKYKNNKEQILMFSDSYDAVLSSGSEAILKSFKQFDARVVFSAEDFCWPNPSLADKYPEVKLNEKRFLNSGGFIGYAPELYEIVTLTPIADADDDQLYYTNIFLDEKLKKQLSIKLDMRGEIFQNLNGALDEVQVKYKGATSYMYNTKTGNIPHVIHGNGPIKVQFNGLTNYLTDNWTPTSGCQSCKQNTISLSGLSDTDYPSVMVAIFIEQPTAFIEDFFGKIANLKYPKSKIDIFIYYADEFHTTHISNFLQNYQEKYNSVKVYGPGQNLNEWEARNRALVECEKKVCQYYFALDGDAQLENQQTLIHLIEANRSVIAPLLVRPGKMWSNFWGALSASGFYKRSDDYVEIIQRVKGGQWNVPYISDAILIHGHLIPKLRGGYKDGDLDADMAICKRIREKGMFMHVDNQQYFGHLVNSDNYETMHKNNDLYSLMDNRYTWEKKYLHPDYKGLLSENTEIAQPCPDVFWFPIFTPTFCWQYIDEMENFGEWSGGKHQDERLAGGYENVPTVDIHTNQIGWEAQWLDILQSYFAPIASKVFLGYFSESRAIMNFVVRYKPGEQDYLRPHHDSSTYSVNVALNRPGIDFEGGGTSFLRYNCKVTKSQQGWALIHPGRLTHWHEGLKTTNGTRYIMVSFVDP